jgi:integrase
MQGDEERRLRRTEQYAPRRSPPRKGNATDDALMVNQGKEQGLTSEYVFTYARRIIGKVDRAFHGALRRAGIENFTFHDLRHTFASHLVMRGASLKEVQELLGHKTMTMTLRYTHLAEENKKRAVGLLNGLTGYVSSDV